MGKKQQAAARRMPLCDYGSACTRRDCVYRHPPRAAPVIKCDQVCKPFLAGVCQFGERCTYQHPSAADAHALRRRYKSTACTWGNDCHSRACLFSHPKDALLRCVEVEDAVDGGAHSAAERSDIALRPVEAQMAAAQIGPGVGGQGEVENDGFSRQNDCGISRQNDGSFSRQNDGSTSREDLRVHPIPAWASDGGDAEARANALAESVLQETLDLDEGDETMCAQHGLALRDGVSYRLEPTPQTSATLGIRAEVSGGGLSARAAEWRAPSALGGGGLEVDLRENRQMDERRSADAAARRAAVATAAAQEADDFCIGGGTQWSMGGWSSDLHPDLHPDLHSDLHSDWPEQERPLQQPTQLLLPLAPGWEVATAPDGGGTYYFHTASRRTTWERPVHPSAAAAAASSAACAAELPSDAAPAAAPSGWAAMASAAAARPTPPKAEHLQGKQQQHQRRAVKIPSELWVGESALRSDAFHIADPFERYKEVNRAYARDAGRMWVPLTFGTSAGGRSSGRSNEEAGAGVVDLHYQSVRTVAGVLDRILPVALDAHAEVWVITGTGHHTNQQSHQRHRSGGVLNGAVEEYLEGKGCTFHKAKDHAGYSGAFLVLRK